jgi:hypothetical protein
MGKKQLLDNIKQCPSYRKPRGQLGPMGDAHLNSGQRLGTNICVLAVPIESTTKAGYLYISASVKLSPDISDVHGTRCIVAPIRRRVEHFNCSRLCWTDIASGNPEPLKLVLLS